eukprot:2573105-Prymnesium_polylepis.1
MTASAHVPAQQVNVECSQHDGSNEDSNRRGDRGKHRAVCGLRVCEWGGGGGAPPSRPQPRSCCRHDGRA